MIYLVLAILMEAAATILLKASEGFTVFLPAVLCVLAYILVSWLIAKALLTLKIGPTYASWNGAGVAMGVILSVFLYHESVSFLAIAGVILVFAGVIICNLSDDESQTEKSK